MELKPVKSSNIEAVGYDADKQELQIQFKGGAVYAYDGVLPDDYEALKYAPSVGSHFHAKIKNNYPTRKV